MKFLIRDALSPLRPLGSWRGALAALLVAALLMLAGVGVASLLGWRQSAPPPLTQKDIDAAVLHTLATKELPSRAARAAAVIGPSVVRVIALGPLPPDHGKNKKSDKKDKADKNETPKPNADGDVELGVGSGVVISEEGLILTNWHVVQGARRLQITFADGTQSNARIKAPMPDQDLALLQAERLPDDLQPATLAGSGGLQPGDEVVAVGFPFGIGPSVSAGVVSGLEREFPGDGDRPPLRGLIQADAAANPGNSGGPLVNMSGEVVGIVTAILNPTRARTFIGIVFAATLESAGAGLGIPPF